MVLAPDVWSLGAEAEMPVCLLCSWASCGVASRDTGIPKGGPPPAPAFGGGRRALTGR